MYAYVTCRPGNEQGSADKALLSMTSKLAAT